MKTLGLYIDFPFCIARCAFCAFPVQGFQSGKAEAYLRALHKEIALIGTDPAIRAREIDSLYLGGGTPTQYSPETLAALVADCRRQFHIASDVEISLEAHPATLNLEGLSTLCEGGINRLSLGVQSFSDAQLRRLGRNHSAKHADAAFQAARAAGFENIGIDLIYGLPEQDPQDWDETLRHALSLWPEHLSIYALSIEEGTRFGRMEQEGRLQLPEDELFIAYYESARAQLTAAGYLQYEISNFAKPGFSCRHNRRYWDRGEIIGLGLAAHSYFRKVRWENTAVLPDYINALRKGCIPLIHKENLSGPEAKVDQIIFGLRKTEGIPMRLLKDDAPRSRTARALAREGLLKIEKGRLWLTHRGTHVADEIAVALM